MDRGGQLVHVVDVVEQLKHGDLHCSHMVRV